jgi:DDB1- and CUL4-associated factor 7
LLIHRQDPSCQFRLAIGSYVEQYSNCVSIIKKNPGSSSSDDILANGGGGATGGSGGSSGMDGGGGGLYKAAEFDHPYPCTKIMWSPDVRLGAQDLLATTGDYLRLWSVHDDDSNGETGGRPGDCTVTKEILLNNNKTSEYCAPLTSFDWNETEPNIVGTSSIDTTCTIWDLTTQTARTQLIAHDREVFDLAFARGKDVFASVGADGSVRMFDLRSLEHSTIIYESPDLDPLLRLEWNKQDPNYLATFMVDSRRTIILDIRVPSLPVAELGGHLGCVNATAWAPHSSCHICTAGDDSQALIWDLSAMPKRPVDDPILAYNADGEINNLQWSTSQPDWVSIAFQDKLQICTYFYYTHCCCAWSVDVCVCGVWRGVVFHGSLLLLLSACVSSICSCFVVPLVPQFPYMCIVRV